MATDIDVNYNFNTPTKYTTNQAQVTGGKGQLALTDLAAQTFNQPFTSDTGFTYDSAKAEFTAGVVRQTDQTPSNSIFGGNFASSIDLDWNKSQVVTATLRGTPTLSGGKIDCTGYAQKGVYWAANTTALETHKFMYTPNHNGAPSSQINIFGCYNGANNNDRFNLYQATSGALKFNLYTHTGTYILAGTFSTWSPTSGQEYELELNIDPSLGLVTLFIDGVLLGGLAPAPFTRGTNVSYYYVGSFNTSYDLANASFDKYIKFDNIQHTANYTPGYTVPSSIYASSKVELPQFSYSDIGSLQAFTAFAVTESNAPRYVVNDLYWSGAAWVSSDGSWSQASSSSDVASNIGSLPASDTVYVDIVFNDGNSQMSVDDITVTYTGQEYYTSGTIVTPELTAEDLDNFDATETNTANTTIKYALYIDGVLYYWDGAAWSLSNGLDAQTNTKADFATNLRTAISTGSTIKFYILIQTSDKQETGEISTLSFSYDFSAIVNNPTTCIIWGYYRDISGNGVNGATVTFKLKKSLSGEYKEASGSIIEKQVTTTTRSNGNNGGYFEMPLVRSSNYEGTGVYAVTIEKSSDGLSVKKNSEGQALEFEAPDALDKDITELITAA